MITNREGLELADKRMNRKLVKRPWVQSIVAFVMLQIGFVIFELTGWIPNYRELDGTLFYRIYTSVFSDWANFYDHPYFNMFTVFFGIIFLSHGVIGAIRDLLYRKKPMA